MKVTRREFVFMSLAPMVAGSVSCSSSQSPTAPQTSTQPSSISLLEAVRRLGHNATASAPNKDGGVTLMINGNFNHQFQVNGSLIGIGGDKPSLNVPAHQVPVNAVVHVITL